MRKLSVIIPVYNSEKYISKCLDSVLAQCKIEIEIILVNDGSKDSSLQLCYKYAEIYPNIIVLSQDNKGPSKARALGLEKASSNYVLFVDADDYIARNTLSELLDKAEDQNIDILQFGCVKIDDKGVVVSHCKLKNNSIEGNFNCAASYASVNNVTNYLCNKLIKRSLFETITFPDLRYSEDYYLLSIIYSKAEKIVTDSSIVYYYLQHSDQATNQVVTFQHIDIIRAGEMVLHFYEQNFPVLSFYAKQYILNFSFYLSAKLFQSKTYNPNKKELLIFLFEKFKQFYKLSDFHKNKSLKMFLFRYFPRQILFAYRFKHVFSRN